MMKTPRPAQGQRIYDEAVREVVIMVWEAADRICGKRLKAAMPHLVESMEPPWPSGSRSRGARPVAVRQRGHVGSAAETHSSHCGELAPTSTRRSIGKAGSRADLQRLERTAPGFLEIDLEAHCGSSVSGSFIHSLVVTDICTGWTETVPLLAREQSLVVEGSRTSHGLCPPPRV